MENLTKALVKAQSEMGFAPKTGYNPHYKNSFSTLEDLINTTRVVLTRNGLAITQYPDSDGHVNFLVTKLKHISGEEEVSRALLTIKDNTDIQKLGSAISYMKRYAYAAICGIATGDEEDDGNTASSITSHAVTQNGSKIEVKTDAISPKQLGLLLGKIKESGNPNLADLICKKYEISNLNQFPWRKFNEVLSLFNPAPTAAQPGNSHSFSPDELEELPF